jgi:hypothetical protein
VADKTFAVDAHVGHSVGFLAAEEPVVFKATAATAAPEMQVVAEVSAPEAVAAAQFKQITSQELKAAAGCAHNIEDKVLIITRVV